MVLEPVIARFALRFGEGTDGEEALGGPLSESMKKGKESREKNGEMDWVKLLSVTPLTEQPVQCHP